MPERWERKPERWAPDGCEQCGRSDTCELTTTGKLLPLWIDNDTGETVCEQCTRIRSNASGEGRAVARTSPPPGSAAPSPCWQANKGLDTERFSVADGEHRRAGSSGDSAGVGDMEPPGRKSPVAVTIAQAGKRGRSPICPPNAQGHVLTRSEAEGQ